MLHTLLKPNSILVSLVGKYLQHKMKDLLNEKKITDREIVFTCVSEQCAFFMTTKNTIYLLFRGGDCISCININK